MRVAVTGASGFIGQALLPALRAAGHDVVTLVRRDPGPGEVRWDPAAGRLDPADLAGVEAGINLSGAGIGDKRWNDAYRRTILESRTTSTTLFAGALADAGATVLLSASGIGVYGDRGEETLDETSAPGSDFLADVCVQWEAATARADAAGLRVVHLRTGLVMGRSGGALAKQLPIFKLGGGGPLGNGRHWQSWITLRDEVGAMVWLLGSQVSGPVNLTAPNPVRQKDFAKALGRAVHRPAVLPAPGFALRLVLGDFADEGVLASQKVLPTVLSGAGFTWTSTEVDEGLTAALTQ